MQRWFPGLLYCGCAIAAWMLGLPTTQAATSRPVVATKLFQRPTPSRITPPTNIPPHIHPEIQPQIAALATQYRLLLQEVQQQQAHIIAEWIKLAEIPAPSRKEQRRARYIIQQMRAIGLHVHQDQVGNVIAVYPGTAKQPRKKIVIMAHMDTVFHEGISHRVRRQGHRLFGPGILDNTIGLINLIVLARMLKKHRVQFHHDLWLVGTVQEEMGLRGAKALFRQHHRDIQMAIALDGGYGGISYGGVGIHWYRIEFHDRARHTLSSMGQPSTTLALARTIQRIYRLRVPRNPPLMQTWYNIGKVGGGHVVNAQAASTWFTVDLRSMNQAQLQHLEQQVFRIARDVAQQSKVRLKIVPLQKTPAIQLPEMHQHPLVRSAQAVLHYLKTSRVQISPFGANDHCVALTYGIPGINIGTTTGAHIHSLQEWADVRYVVRGIQQTFLLTALMAR